MKLARDYAETLSRPAIRLEYSFSVLRKLGGARL